MTTIAQSFEDAVETYRQFLDSAGLVVPLLRIETHVESTRDWSQVATFGDVKSWFEGQ